MNLKNINNFFLIFITFFIISCQTLDIIKKDDKVLKYQDNFQIENLKFIDNEINNIKSNYSDYYTDVENFEWNRKDKLKKTFIIKNSINKNQTSNPLNVQIVENKIYIINFDGDFSIYNQENGKLIESNKKLIKLNTDYSYPTSFSFYKNKFYLSISDGRVFCINLNGSIIWEKNFNDIIKTPIKIHNDNLIILLSNEILSLDPENGSVNWQLEYNLESSLNAYGGSIIDKNQNLFFILPNNRVGQVDTILGKKSDSLFSNFIFNQDLPKNTNNINLHKNFLSIFDNFKYLNTINIKDDKYVLNEFLIPNVQSFYFFKNSLITLKNDSTMIASNIENGNVFWQTDLKDYLKKKNRIVEIINNEKLLVVIFNNGLLLELDIKTGNILYKQNLKLSEVSFVNFKNNFIIFYLSSGKIVFFKI